MFWKKRNLDNTYRYVAVVEIEDRTSDKNLFGQRTYGFKLFDGTTEERTFEPKDWALWQQSVLNKGFVLNP